MTTWRPGADAFRLAPVPLAVVDAREGTVLAVNLALEAKLGTEARLILGQHWPSPLGGSRADFASLVSSLGEGSSGVVEGQMGAAIDPVWWRQRVARVQEPSGRSYLIIEVEDRTREHRFTEELARAANHDELTGLWNRRRFRRELRTMLGHATGPFVGLVLFDVDGFKLVNDTHGHAVGDAALVAVAEALRVNAPAGSGVARLSGDEFAVVFSAPGAEAARDRACRLVAQTERVVVGPSLPDIALSAGMAVAEPGPDPELRVQQVMIQADLDLYASKTRAQEVRRSPFPADEEVAPLAAEWDADDERQTGPTEGGFEVWSHPLVATTTGRPVLHDLVMRGPATTIDLESLVQVVHLVQRHTNRVVGQPLNYLLHLPGFPLGAGAIAHWLSRAADDAGLSRASLTFSLSESRLVSVGPAGLLGMTALRDEGFGVAVDEFGAEIGSLRLLADLRPDQVWLSPELIRRGVLAAVVDVVHAHGGQTGVAGVREIGLRRFAEEGIDLAMVPDPAARRPLGAVGSASISS